VALVFDLDRVVQHVCFAFAKPNILKSYAVGSVSLSSFSDPRAKRHAGHCNGRNDPRDLKADHLADRTFANEDDLETAIPRACSEKVARLFRLEHAPTL
jgi:hypothetical protein